MNKIKTIIAVVMMIASLQNSMLAQQVIWANQGNMSNIGVGNGNNIVSDASGNAYLSGYFGNTAIFSPDTLYTYQWATFLVKYSPSGNVLWARSSNAAGLAQCFASGVDGLNNVYITGYFTQYQAIFGQDTIPLASGNQIFTVKYDSAGNVIWAKGGNGATSYSVTGDAFGNCYLTGAFGGTVTFGTHTITSVGSSDIFLVKYDPSGNVIWAIDAGGTSSDVANCVATDTIVNVYLGGFFTSNPAHFGSLNINRYGSSYNDFLAKYDSAGNAIWVINGEGTNSINGIAFDHSGNILVTGYFGSDSLILGSHLLINSLGNGFVEMFIAKYDSSGNALWAKRSTGETKGERIVCDSQDNAYVSTGGNNNNIPVSFDNINLVPSINADATSFLVKYDSSGNAVCGLVFESGGQGGINNGLALGPNGSFYFGGSFLLNPFVIYGDTLRETNGTSPFILRISPGPVVTSAFSIDTFSGCKPLTVQFTNHSTNATSYLWNFGNTTSTAINPTHTYNSTGTYNITLIAYDSTACGNSADTSHLLVYFTVFPPPNIPVITQDADTLFSSYTTGNQWYFDTVAIPGAVNRSLIVSIAGCYYVIETDSERCSSKSDSVCFIYTRINGMIEDKYIFIYPNPTSSLLTLSLPNNNQKAIINLYDIYGQLIIDNGKWTSTNTVSSGMSIVNYQLSIKKIPQGIYFLEMLMDGEKVVRKVVKLN